MYYYSLLHVLLYINWLDFMIC